MSQQTSQFTSQMMWCLSKYMWSTLQPRNQQSLKGTCGTEKQEKWNFKLMSQGRLSRFSTAMMKTFWRNGRMFREKMAQSCSHSRFQKANLEDNTLFRWHPKMVTLLTHIESSGLTHIPNLICSWLLTLTRKTTRQGTASPQKWRSESLMERSYQLAPAFPSACTSRRKGVLNLRVSTSRRNSLTSKEKSY